jgi:F-box protein 9
MDPDVDKQYKQKYFSPGAVPLPMRNPDDFQSGYSIQEYHPSSTTTDTISTLTEAFASLSILRIEAEDSEKPCFLGTLPDELLVNILYHLSLDSLDSLARTALVCKKLFTLSQGENSLYKALCMHYFRPFDSPSTLLSRISEYNNDWRRMLIERPRIRFDGCYIATCHYLRPGVNEYSWNTPIHMVTYFRYMRFYENGRCLTVLSSIEPREVVRSVSWSGSVGLKGVSDGVWSMKEGGAVLVQVRGPKGYTFIKELQV